METVVVGDGHEDRTLLAVVPGEQEHGEPRQNHAHDRGTQPTKHAGNGSTRAPPDRRPTDGRFGWTRRPHFRVTDGQKGCSRTTGIPTRNM